MRETSTHGTVLTHGDGGTTALFAFALATSSRPSRAHASRAHTHRHHDGSREPRVIPTPSSHVGVNVAHRGGFIEARS